MQADFLIFVWTYRPLSPSSRGVRSSRYARSRALDVIFKENKKVWKNMFSKKYFELLNVGRISGKSQNLTDLLIAFPKEFLPKVFKLMNFAGIWRFFCLEISETRHPGPEQTLLAWQQLKKGRSNFLFFENSVFWKSYRAFCSGGRLRFRAKWWISEISRIWSKMTAMSRQKCSVTFSKKRIFKK